LTPEASYNVGAPIQGVWLQRSVESSSKIITAIHAEQLIGGDDGGMWRCELSLFTLQLSPVEFGSSFTLEARLELPDFYLWLLEGDFILFVDGLMDIRVWNWKLGLWGHITDETNRPIDGLVGVFSVLGNSALIFPGFDSVVASQT
jgi:hypothetical protein